MDLIGAIYELWENILAVFLVIVIISATAAINDINSNKAFLLSNQFSKVGSLISDENVLVKIKLEDDVRVSVDSNNNLKVNVNGKVKNSKVVGENLNFEQEANSLVITTS